MQYPFSFVNMKHSLVISGYPLQHVITPVIVGNPVWRDVAVEISTHAYLTLEFLLSNGTRNSPKVILNCVVDTKNQFGSVSGS